MTRCVCEMHRVFVVFLLTNNVKGGNLGVSDV